MGVVLLTWNPDHWSVAEIVDFSKKLQTLPFQRNWSCNTYNVVVGDHFFILLQGKSTQRGIVAYGRVLSKPFIGDHWNASKRLEGEKVRYITIEIQEYLDPSSMIILSTKFLNERFPNQHWSPQSSGITVLSEYHALLISEWRKIVESKLSINDVIQNAQRHSDTTQKTRSSNSDFNNNSVRITRKKNIPDFDLDFDD
jgi:hypothetical protein